MNQERLKIQRFKTIYEKNREAGQAGVYIIEQNGVHDPYGWLNHLDNLPYPAEAHLNNIINGKNCLTFPVETIVSSYANAVYSMDTEFQSIIDYLKQMGSYENTTLVFLSDHGESLGHKNTSGLTRHHSGNVYFHGHSLHKEEITAPFAIKFNEQVNMHYSGLQDKTLSGVDFFPTLLDGLKYELDDAKAFYRGGSVLQNTHQSEHVTILPSWTAPTRRLCLTNDQYKVHLLIDKHDFYKANGFKIIGVHTLDDQPVVDTHEKANVIDNIETLFPMAIEQIFPMH